MAALRHGAGKIFFSSVFSYAEILGLDICMGAIGSGVLAASLLNANMRPVWWFVFPAAVWVVYTAGHLLAARKTEPDSIDERHKFHREHFTVLTILVVLVAIGCCIVVLLYLSDILWQGGLFLCLLVALHLVLAFWGKMQTGKEISIAVIYSLGVWFGPYVRRSCAISWIHLVGFLLFMLAAMLNLFMNSILEYETDKRGKLRFATDVLSLSRVRVFVIVASWLASLGILVFLKYGLKHRIEFIVLAGFCFLLILCAVPGVIVSEEVVYKKIPKFRRKSEWIFSLGILLVFIPK